MHTSPPITFGKRLKELLRFGYVQEKVKVKTYRKPLILWGG